MFGKKKCPKCDGENLNAVKAEKSLRRLLFPSIQELWFPKKPLNVCRDCGFSWEDR